MRRTALCLPLLALVGCSNGLTTLIAGGNPNAPKADSVNIRRSLGDPDTVAQLDVEPGDIWPGPQKSDPTLIDLQRDDASEAARGFARTAIPGTRVPGATDHEQPRPVGSSTPSPNGDLPGPGLGRAPLLPPTAPPPPATSVPGPGPLGRVTQTPRGPVVDAGGTPGYRQLLTPRGPGAIMVPNNNGTSTILEPGGGIQTVPTPR